MPHRPKTHRPTRFRSQKRQPTHYQIDRESAPAKPKEEDAPGKPSGDPFYSSRRWRKLRLLILSSNPLCMDPFGLHSFVGMTEVATEVHHIVSRRRNPSLAFTRSNLMGLCRNCHTRVTASEMKNRSGSASA